MTRWLIFISAIIFGCTSQSNLFEPDPQVSSNNQSKRKFLSGKKSSYKISGPYTHKNLSIFLVHGKDKLKKQKILTLQEAIAQKKAIIYETGNVNKLSIENISEDEQIFVQSGDIVKGGKQDRVISIDFLLLPKSGKKPIGAFCVEQGRWSKRGGESVAKFSSSNDNIASRELKLAVKLKKNQSSVWKEVSKSQKKLTATVGESVQSNASGSSMQLALENKKVKQTTQEYINVLNEMTTNKKDILGYAFAVNGKINSADIYASRDLFNKLWPKLLKSSSVEAVAEYKQDLKIPVLKVKDVENWLAEAKKAKAEQKDVDKRIKILTRKSKRVIVQETAVADEEVWEDALAEDNFIHESFLDSEGMEENDSEDNDYPNDNNVDYDEEFDEERGRFFEEEEESDDSK